MSAIRYELYIGGQDLEVGQAEGGQFDLEQDFNGFLR